MPETFPAFDEAMTTIRRLCEAAQTEQEAAHYSRVLIQQGKYAVAQFRSGNPLTNMLRENPLPKPGSGA